MFKQPPLRHDGRITTVLLGLLILTLIAGLAVILPLVSHLKKQELETQMALLKAREAEERWMDAERNRVAQLADQQHLVAEEEKKRQQAEEQARTHQRERDLWGEFAGEVAGEAERAFQLAKVERARAQTAVEALNAYRAAVREKLEQAEWNRYGGLIEQARQATRAGQVVTAQTLLDQTRWDFRNWEYHHVQSQCRLSTHTLRGDGNRYYTHVTYSPDGRWLAASGTEHIITIWDTKSGKKVTTLPGVEHTNSPLTFSSDGQRMLCLDLSQKIIRWIDLSTGKATLEIKEPTLRFAPVSATRDGTKIVAGSGGLFETDPGGEVKLWDGISGKELRQFKAHDKQIVALALSPDGKLLATASTDQTVRLWNLDTGERLYELGSFLRAPSSIQFSPDGKRVAASGRDRWLKIWDSSTGKEVLATRPPVVANNLQFTSDGKQIVTVGVGTSVYAVGEVSWLDSLTGRVIQSLQLNRDFHRGVAIRPDGGELALPVNRTIQRWSLPVVLGPRRLLAHTNGALSFDFRKDGKRLVSGGNDRLVKVWDVDSGRELLAMPGHTLGVHGVAYSPDGGRIVSCSGGFLFEKGKAVPEVKVWDAESGKELLSLSGHEGVVLSASFSPDGKKIFTSGRDKTMRFWDATTGKALKTISNEKAYPSYAQPILSPDGTRIYGVVDQLVRCWNAESGEVIASAPRTGLPTSLSFSPDGKTLLVSSLDRTVRGYDAESLKEVYFLVCRNQFLSGAAISPDGQRIVTSGQEGLVTVWHRQKKVELISFNDHADRIAWVRFSPEGTRLVSASYDGNLNIYESQPSVSSTNLCGAFEDVETVCLSKDGKRLISTGHDAHLRVWDMISGQQITTIPRPEYMGGVSLSPDGKLVSVTGKKGGNTLDILDTTTGKLHNRLELGASVRSVDFHPDGKRLALVLSNGTIEVREALSGSVSVQLAAREETPLQVRFSVDGTRFAVGYRSGKAPRRVIDPPTPSTAIIYDLSTGKPIVTCKGHGGEVHCVSFSPDGRYLATGSGDKTVKIWNATTGDLLATSRPWRDTVRCVTYSPDGKMIAGGTDHGELQILSSPSAKVLGDLEGFRYPRSGICFTPDSKKVMASGSSFVVRIVDLAQEGIVPEER